MDAFSPTNRKYVVVLLVVRYVGLGVLVLSLFFQIINPTQAVVLIIAVAVGSNVGLRLLARLSRLDIILYLIYVGIVFGLGGLWISSFITTVQAAVVFIPATIAYLTVSWIKN